MQICRSVSRGEPLPVGINCIWGPNTLGAKLLAKQGKQVRKTLGPGGTHIPGDTSLPGTCPAQGQQDFEDPLLGLRGSGPRLFCTAPGPAGFSTGTRTLLPRAIRHPRMTRRVTSSQEPDCLPRAAHRGAWGESSVCILGVQDPQLGAPSQACLGPGFPAPLGPRQAVQMVSCVFQTRSTKKPPVGAWE